jgi:NAD(P)-dependent dehydrogenase (short-subunit alcohol dehydrogenase family)
VTQLPSFDLTGQVALVTGASSGIGLAIANMLGEEGYALTVASRRAEKLEPAVEALKGKGYEVEHVAGNLGDEDVIKSVVAAHRDRYGRLDVLVNNAGVGIGAAVGEIQTKYLDIQLNTNIRSIVLFHRDCIDMLRSAGAEHRNALIVNTASMAGKLGQAWLSVYAATKFAVVGWTQSMHRELAKEGIKSSALCPGFVDTAMTDFVKEQVKPEDMIQVSDIAETVRVLLKMTPGCVVPEIQFLRPGEAL